MSEKCHGRADTFSQNKHNIYGYTEGLKIICQNIQHIQLVIELKEIQQMQSKGSFSQFEHKVFKSKLNGLIEVKSACSYFSPFS
jgi:helix-turn-helix protein